MSGIQTAGKSTERRKNQAILAHHEASAGNGPPAQPHAPFGMEMAGDFRRGFRTARFVTQEDTVKPHLARHFSRREGSRHCVMIAHNPRPRPSAHQLLELRARGHVEPSGAILVMKAVAKAPDFCGIREAHQPIHGCERRVAVVGRKHLPSSRKPARFLQMQVRQKKRAARGPVKSAIGQRHENMAVEGKFSGGLHASGYGDVHAPFQHGAVSA